MDPVPMFRDLYDRVGLPFTAAVEQAILASTGDENVSELSVKDAYRTRLNSRVNLKNWLRRLTPSEVERIRELTAGVADQFYDDDDWAA